MSTSFYTSEIDLGIEKTETLLTLLEAVENAEKPSDAVYLDKEGREAVAEIRELIEEQTGLE